MKKIGLLVKELSEERIKNKVKDSEALFILRYSGLSSPDITMLRQSLKSRKCALFVAKNSVMRRAFKDVDLDKLCDRIDGPTGLVFIKDEPVSASRILCDFLKTREQLKLAGGFLKETILEAKDIEALAKLPSKETLRAQVVMALNSPIFGIVNVLNQSLRKFVWCIEEIRKKKESVK